VLASYPTIHRQMDAGSLYDRTPEGAWTSSL
jgi:hypothetical protein